MPPLRDEERFDVLEDEDGDDDGADDTVSPRAFAQRARAEAASFARVAADIGRRRRSPPRLALVLVLLPLLLLRVVDEEDSELPPNNARMRSCNASICSRRETASFSLSRDRSMIRSNLSAEWRN